MMETKNVDTSWKNAIRINLHGHGLAGYDEWWKEQYGIQGQNLAKVFADRCLKKGLEIYTITDEPCGPEDKTRFEYVRREAQNLARENNDYVLHDDLGDHAFTLSTKKGKVCFLDGQSLRVKEGDQTYELLTFGSSGLPDFSSFNEAFNHLSGEGLPAISEHPFSQGHYGPQELELLEEQCLDGKLLAIEHNAKMSVPNFFSMVPKFNGYLRRTNDFAAEVAARTKTPFIANDDSDSPVQIGSAYTIINGDKVDFKSDRSITNSIVNLIKEEEFSIHPGYTSFFEWSRYAVWTIGIKEGALNCKERYEKKNSR